jgi:GNAT superfamily N-acetyltransferase
LPGKRKMPVKKEIRLRRFESRDLEEVDTLIERTINACCRRFCRKEIIAFFGMYRRQENILKTASDGYVTVADVNGKVAATGSLLGDLVLRVFVDPLHQKKGLGRMIMTALERQAASAGVEGLRLRSPAGARGFYESLGYRTAGCGFEDTGRGTPQDGLVYYKMVKAIDCEEAVSVPAILQRTGAV